MTVGIQRSKRTVRREVLRERLLEVVEQLLDRGVLFNEISVELLVTEAGIARSTFYAYFEDKGDLLGAWLISVNAQLAEVAREWWAIDASSDRDDLRAIQAKIFEVYRPHVQLMDAAVDSASTDLAVRETHEREMRRNAAALRKHIKAGQAAGFIAPGIDGPETAEWLTRMSERGMHKLVTKNGSAERYERLVDAYTDIVWNTLYSPARV